MEWKLLSKTECYYSLAVATPIGTTSFTYDGTKSDCLTKITFPDGKVFSTYYDSIGNPSHVMTGNGNRYAATWSYGRRLTGLSSGSEAFSYSYNADGIRTAKTVNGVKHTYALSGTTILNEEWTENGVQHLLMYVYDANGSPTGMVYRNSTMSIGVFEEYLFVKNIQGDILHVYNSAGKKLVSYVYDAWGNIISTTYSNGGATTAARFNPFTYRGYYRDSETGMYYLNSRYYNPKMGRFISADGVINGNGDLLGYNLYAYCSNNPINRADVLGDAWYNVLFDWVNTISGTFNPRSKLTAVGAAGVAAVGGRWSDLVSDWNNGCLNPFNQDESVALNAKVVGFYKGSTVVRHGMSGTSSIFGTIWADNSRLTSDDIKHEYGHSVQERIMGINYYTTVALPSAATCLYDQYINRISESDYYSMPWERTADLFGGAKRTFQYKNGSIAWSIAENVLGLRVVPFYLMFGY